MSDPAPVSAGSEPPDGQEGLAEMLAAHEWRPLSSAHNSHQYDAWCAICIGDVTALAAALAPWVAQREAEHAEQIALAIEAEAMTEGDLVPRDGPLFGQGYDAGWQSAIKYAATLARADRIAPHPTTYPGRRRVLHGLKGRRRGSPCWTLRCRTGLPTTSGSTSSRSTGTQPTGPAPPPRSSDE